MFNSETHGMDTDGMVKGNPGCSLILSCSLLTIRKNVTLKVQSVPF